MKHLILLLFIGVLTLTLGCLKEETDSKEASKPNKNYYYNTDFDPVQGRSGTVIFHSPFTLVELDITYPTTLTIHNIAKVDSVYYERVKVERNIYKGIDFDPFMRTIYFADGTQSTEKRLVPDYIQNGVAYPDIDYNQLNIANPENWVSLKRTDRKDKPYHTYCGKEIWRFFYNIKNSSGLDIVGQHEAHICTGALPYQLIF